MKIFDENMQVTKTAGFAFSNAKPERLGASEYTLVTLVTDRTGSVSPYAAQLLEMKKSVVEACKKSPRRDFLMLRNVEFAEDSEEINGFCELKNIDPSAFKLPNCTGMTALYDATWMAMAATNEYAKILSAQDFGVNAAIFIETDGDDNASSYTPAMVAEEISRGVREEYLESVTVVLIGINAAQYRHKLEQYAKDAGMQQYVDVKDASPKELARLANFITRSISSQSQSLGTGGPSQALVF